MIKVERQEADAMRYSDVAGALGHSTIKDFGRRTMRVLLEKMMLDFPNIVDPDTVGEFNLRERLPISIVFAQCMPRARGLHFIKQAEFHSSLQYRNWPAAKSVGQYSTIG